ncbi:MAG: hypothetical protein ACK5H2_10120 [Beutenbergiaceae bacterium]
MTSTDLGGLLLTHREHSPELRRAIRAGVLERIRRGAYAPPQPESHAQRRIRAFQRIVAVAAGSRSPVVISHESAALLWGLPTLRIPIITHLIQPSPASGRDAADVKRHCLQLPDHERTIRERIPVTTLQRTVLDCARTLPLREAIVIADAALTGGLDPHALIKRVRTIAGRPGARRAREVTRLMRPGSESAGESLTRVALVEGGLPEPEVQLPVWTPFGSYRLDMGWREWQVGLEFDGKVKYSELTDDPAEVLFAEKERQNAIEAQGWILVRATFRDLRDPVRLCDLVGGVLRRAGWPAT